jgi:hypothetical protein
MTALLLEPSYATLSYLTGQPVQVLSEGGGTVELWLECLSSPVTFAGNTSYSVRLTGPAHDVLPTGAQLLRTTQGELVLVLEPVARDLRHQHYEAFLTETVTA